MFGKYTEEALDRTGYTNTTQALIKNVDDEYKWKWGELNNFSERSLENQTGNLKGNTMAAVFINEAGLYSLLLSSKLPEAKAFRKWVLSVVLPSIRKTGSYSQPEPEDQPVAIREPPPLRPALQHFDKDKISKNNRFYINNETDLHTRVVSWIRKYHKDNIMIAGLGEFQSTPDLRIEGYRKGYTKGTCDLMILNNHVKYKGMGIEFKTPKGDGKLSEHQEEFLSQLQLNGYYILVSNDYDEIIEELRKYLEGVRLICPNCKKKNMYYKTTDALNKHCAAFHGTVCR